MKAVKGYHFIIILFCFPKIRKISHNVNTVTIKRFLKWRGGKRITKWYNSHAQIVIWDRWYRSPKSFTLHIIIHHSTMLTGAFSVQLILKNPALKKKGFRKPTHQNGASSITDLQLLMRWISPQMSNLFIKWYGVRILKWKILILCVN